MKLSEAIMLGSTQCKMEPASFSTCVLGVSLWAIGLPARSPDWGSRYDLIAQVWPWTDAYSRPGKMYLQEIYQRFDHRVCTGEMTLEQLVDYVKSVEPECGECCRFDCVCRKVKESSVGSIAESASSLPQESVR
jgi:hypothetical protein